LLQLDALFNGSSSLLLLAAFEFKGLRGSSAFFLFRASTEAASGIPASEGLGVNLTSNLE
jgi:hypothetical protein